MKVPKARKLSSGKWYIYLRIGSEQISVTAETEAQCQAEAMAIKSGLKAAPVAGGSKTLRHAIDDYIDARRNTLSPSTIAGYKRIQENRFQSVMNTPLKDIKGWQRLCDLESRSLSPKTVRNSYRFIVSVLTDNGITPEKVTLPALQNNTRTWLEPDEVKTLVKSVYGTPEELYVFFGLHSLRRSEIAAMRWENIDLTNGTITVKGAAVYDEKGKVVYKSANKNTTSTRTIPIMIPEFQEALQREQKPSGLVFTCSVKTIHERVNRACKRAGLPEVGTHGLRHSFASLAYHLGMSEMETMELGGWSDTSTMRKIYTHLATADRLKAENKLKQFFKNANQNVN